ncbi:hypothetical protein ADL00_42865 [Streptomyces sp. AS58]|uniref:DUF4234 domain-containing protein n=1 Tax=Streptomyces sp. AS58 TaxID=1519489 RepID=UPI0006AF6274|nr:DUF4234 domain-containing protein [Streptomyces sp. AS58]KOV50721.1 hypothetical protein ADL00_42865 [Streptomyces sp. AS58]
MSQSSATPVQQGAGLSGLAMKKRNPLGAWLGLPIITLGIYGLVWYFKINKEMKKFDSRREVSPGVALLAITFGSFILVPPFVSYYKTGKRIAETQRAAGLQPTCSPIVGLLLMLVFGFGVYYMQAELNKVVATYGEVAPGSPIALRG